MIFFFFIRFLLSFIIIFALFSIIRQNFFAKYKRKSSRKRELLLCAFVAFALSILSQMLTPNFAIENAGINLGIENSGFIGNYKDRWGTKWGINFVPFKTIKSYLMYIKGKNAFYNLVGNIIIFLPLGFGLPLLWKKFNELRSVLLTLLLTSVLIEFVQYFVGRSVDVDDVILNTLGGILGFFIYKKFFYSKACYRVLRR